MTLVMTSALKNATSHFVDPTIFMKCREYLWPVATYDTHLWVAMHSERFSFNVMDLSCPKEFRDDVRKKCIDNEWIGSNAEFDKFFTINNLEGEVSYLKAAASAAELL